MEYICMLIGTIMGLIFIVQLGVGKKYENMLEPLNGDDYPLYYAYGVGLALQDIPLFKLKGKLGDGIRNSCNILYGAMYGEFYARITWAQLLTFPLMIMTMMILIGGLFGGAGAVFFPIAGIVFSAIINYYFYDKVVGAMKTRAQKCEDELPDATSTLALLINSGMILRDAWILLANSKEGVFYDIMKEICIEMQNGTSDIDAVYNFGVKTGSQEIKKFTSSLIQSIERGGGDLPGFLTQQSSELWERHRQNSLQKGERAASALIAPIGVMFGGIIMIILGIVVQTFLVMM